MMRRVLLVTGGVIASVALLTVPHGRGPSLEQMFVAQTQAAVESDHVCVMGTEDDQTAPPQGQNAAAAQAARLSATVDTSSDLPPVRMVVDPYPSFNGVFVDTAGD